MAKHTSLLKRLKDMALNKKPTLLCDNKFNSGCDYHRVVMPFSNVEIKPRTDVLVFNRIFSKGADAVAKLKRQGVKIVVDLDDFYQLNPEHYLAHLYAPNTRTIVEMVKIADIVIVTTEYLAYKVRHLNSNVVVIRNALPFDDGQFTLSNDRTSGTPIVWAGGASHEPDLRLLSNTFDDSLLSIAGYEASSTVTGQEWVKIRRSLPNAQYKPAVHSLDEYMSVYDGHAMAIAPLVDNDFNHCKSNLKVLEAGAKGLPLVCSPRENYFTEEFKDLLFFAETKSEWEDIVNYLIQCPDVGIEKGLALAKYVRKHYHIDVLNERRRLLFEEL